MVLNNKFSMVTLEKCFMKQCAGNNSFAQVSLIMLKNWCSGEQFISWLSGLISHQKQTLYDIM